MSSLLIPGLLLALAVVYASTLQTQISGSFQKNAPDQVLKNEYIKDVAEIQVALNVWGTIHHTGYPLFAILGNLFTLPLRAVGVEPAAAASLYATFWGAILLGALGLLLWRLTGSGIVAALSVVLLGLARSIWIHNVIAEVYSMSLAITALMFVVALWPAPWRGAWSFERRVGWLMLLGGIGVAHHRAVAFVAPGLLLAVWPHLWAKRRRWRKMAPPAVALALIGFLPYLYLPVREWQGSAWVYGEPGTLRGFWTEFSGKEASYLVNLPSDLAGLWHNAASVWQILIHEITLPGLLAGLIGLGIAVTVSLQRRAARVIALSAAGPTLFAVFYHTAVLPEAILMPAVLALIFGVALTVNDLRRERYGAWALVGMGVWAVALAGWHYGYVHELVTEPDGIKTIERIEQLPRDGQTALMLPWGPRYAAASYSKLVTGDNRDLTIVDHKGDYRALLAEGYRLYTEPETFYTYPPPWPTDYGAASDWWTEHLGYLYLTSAAPGFIQLQNVPALAGPDEALGTPIVYGITRRQAWLTCTDRWIYLHVVWSADNRPDGDPSIFVHLTADEPAPNPPNADARHPVYSLYPFARWSPGEIVRDDFTLPRLPDKTQVRFGLYDQDASGQFINYGEVILPITGCLPEPNK
jgi:hypothetical protein